MTCTASALMAQARCYQGLPKNVVRAFGLALLCNWANHSTPPAAPFRWEPEATSIQWTDSGGVKTGDYPTFLATADIATVTSVEMDGRNITGVFNIGSLPALQHFEAQGNLITTFDFTGSNNLQYISINFNPLASVIYTGCSSVTYIDMRGFVMTTIASVDLRPCTALLSVYCDDNPALATINANGLASLAVLTCSYCNLGDLFVVGDSAIVQLWYDNNPSINIVT